MGFARLVGHERTVKLIRAMLDSDRLPHALLLTGPEGVGKHTLALGLAQAANCLADLPDRPCGRCRACTKIERGTHPDVSEILPEGRLRVIKIESVRELRKQIAFRPYEGRTKVFIVRQADRMQVQSDSAANALLKTLEEPPPSSLLILTAPKESDLLTTIVSRCLRLQLAPLPLNTIEDWLGENRGLTGPRAHLVAVMSEGCLGKVIEVDPEEVWDRRRVITEKMKNLGQNRMEDAMDWAEELSKNQESWALSLSLIRFWLRDLMVLAGGGAKYHLINQDLVEEIEAASRGKTPQPFIKALEEVERAGEALDRLVRPDLVFENLMLSLTEISGR